MSILLGPSAFCGCGDQNAQDKLQCCNVVDLGQIYEEEPEYSANNPCEPTRTDEIVSQNGISVCQSTPDPEPYGEVLDYTRACARLVVWSNAKIEYGSLTGNRSVLYSRQRDDLPVVSGGNCSNPIYCPATNEIFTCCTREINEPTYQIGGPYDGCTIDQDECVMNCSNPINPYFKHGMSNCGLDTGGKKVILAGYALAPNNWWFLEDDAFSTVTDTITESNPHGSAKQTIYAHFQLEWKPIRCNSNGGELGSPCNGRGSINKRDGRCGASRIAGLSNKEEREKAVKITAAIGFSLGDCGYTPEKACSMV